MQSKEYIDKAMRTCIHDDAGDMIREAAAGIASEAGEVLSLIRKWEFQGHPLLPDQIIDEMGDVFWFMAEMATALDITFEEICQRNLDKTLDRYPHGFDPFLSLNRAK